MNIDSVKSIYISVEQPWMPLPTSGPINKFKVTVIVTVPVGNAAFCPSLVLIQDLSE